MVSVESPLLDTSINADEDSEEVRALKAYIENTDVGEQLEPYVETYNPEWTVIFLYQDVLLFNTKTGQLFNYVFPEPAHQNQAAPNQPVQNQAVQIQAPHSQLLPDDHLYAAVAPDSVFEENKKMEREVEEEGEEVEIEVEEIDVEVEDEDAFIDVESDFIVLENGACNQTPNGYVSLAQYYAQNSSTPSQQVEIKTEAEDPSVHFDPSEMVAKPVRKSAKRSKSYAKKDAYLPKKNQTQRKNSQLAATSKNMAQVGKKKRLTGEKLIKHRMTERVRRKVGQDMFTRLKEVVPFEYYNNPKATQLTMMRATESCIRDTKLVHERKSRVLQADKDLLLEIQRSKASILNYLEKNSKMV